jgi:hypothetical protein
VEVTPSGGGRSKGKIVAAAVGAVAIVGAGVFAITRISGDGAASGGADTPEAAANLLLDALDNEDALGAVDVLLPGERETFREPMQRIVTRLTDWEVLSDDNLSGIGGIDITVTDRDVVAEETNVADIVNLTVSASLASKVDGEALPIGDWLREQIGDEEITLIDEETAPEDGTFPVTAVRKDGRWYLSLFYTAAEQARAQTDFDVPAEGIAPVGGDSPEAAMDNLLAAVAGLDLNGVIATLNPNEFEALQRYAPLFVDDGQAELDDAIREADVTIDVTDTAYDVSGEGAKRSVVPTAISVEISAEGETLSGRFEDGCFIVSVPDQDEDLNSCEAQQMLEDELDLDDMVEDPQAVEDAIADVQAAFADYENPGFIVQQVDGTWYVSPMATVSDQVLAVMEALSRDELENLSTQISDLAATFEDEVGNDFAIPDFDDFGLSDDGEPTTVTAVPDPVTPDETTVPDDTSMTDDTTEATFAGDECYELEAAEAATCFGELVASGEVDELSVPWFFRFPECGAGEVIWSGDYYTLADDEFVAQVDAWQSCVQPLIEAGEDATAFAEVGAPQCLEGRNPYLSGVSSEDFDTFLDCVYG